MSKARTLGELRRTYPLEKLRRSVKDEARENLIAKLRSGERVFPGIHGYDDTVIPGLINAILARHNFILLGLRGQAKSRILRQLTDLLDEEIPALPTELRDNPLAPLSAEAKRLLEEAGEDAPIVWVPRSERYVEKLATPDTTVADILGDIDPIKAARRGSGLSDLEAVHYGLLPRANRGIFAINEVADLAPKVQVALFNILQEGDVQIRGYPVRLALDVWLTFTANPQDYTARGKIVTPLKDRIGSEIRTHYPRTLEEGLAITRQEAWVAREEGIYVPAYVAEASEAVAFVAREDKRVDKTSGVSQRLSISLLELVVSNAERRALRFGERPVARPLDLYAALPAITGKIELEYEGELQGAERVAKDLLLRAFGMVYGERARGLATDEIVQYFSEGHLLTLPEAGAKEVLGEMEKVPGLLAAARKLEPQATPEALVAAAEFILEGLAGRRKIARGEESYSAPLERGERWGSGN
ncbi:cobaltochelatase subunit [Meiothermus luteus]|jgi:magnesium chelatase subunit I|uniref:Cobaltochelatase subunit n=1 Tax=Meiothermus luteus TaxID=2026184 RepID=A0A399EXK8_9DEIN|nr:sigma 54-interacting transcriptional regulator [Meiothermus luteus]RIH88463.1 cobaltochelatase subunit [Meiothermus luteus]RMH57337.1 MAG: magnesium chelatase [Deinococcota bacterium]